MESSVESQLAQIERDRIAVYLKRSKQHWWYLPVVATATALMFASYDLESRALGVALVLVYAVAMGALAGMQLRSGGATPRLSSMPREFVAPLVTYIVVLVLAMIAAWYFAARTELTHTMAGVGVGIVMWLGGWITYRVTESRADRLAAELDIER